MKSCPKCGTQYPDDTLQFCLQDGTPLAGARISDTPTVVLGETETVVARSGGDRIRVSLGGDETAGWQQSRVTSVVPLQSERSSAKTVIAVVVTAFIMLVLFGILGVGAWLMFRDRTPDVAANRGTNAIVPANLGPTVTPTTISSTTPTPSRTAAPTPVTTPFATPPPPPPTPAPALKSYPATTRLVMARGAYSTSFSGDLNPGGSRSLVLGCRSGQSLSANVSSPGSCVSVSGGGTSLRAITRGGDNYISVTNRCSTVVRFSISITII